MLRMQIDDIGARLSCGFGVVALILAVLGFLLLGPPTLASSPTATIETRVWQDVTDLRSIHISARPAGGFWRSFGTRALALEDGYSFAGRYRYGDTALALPTQGPAPNTVELRVSQAVANGHSIFISGRSLGESWLRLGMIALPLDDGFSLNRRYRYGDIRLAVPLPSSHEQAACSNGVVVSQPEQRPELVHDCAVLLQERDALTGDDGRLSWNVEDPIEEWLGITTSGQPPRVTGISIRSLLQGRIPPGLARLDGLRTLRLYENQLTGEIPRELSLLHDLQIINISSSSIAEMIPPELALLPNLAGLLLDNNQLGGVIPPEVAALASLRNIDLSSNQLSGEVPVEFGRPGLSNLLLHNNRLSGAIPPELGLARSLTALGLSGNLLTGPIPPALGSLERLTSLWLSDNALSGPIPKDLANLTRLSTLALHNNQLSGKIPAEVVTLPNLRTVALVNNPLTGCIPIALRSKLGRLHYDDGRGVGVVQLPWCDAVQIHVAVPPLDQALVAACAGGAVLSEVTQSQDSINDCAALLEAKKILEGDSGDLNWAPNTPIRDWTGVWFDGTAGGVREVVLWNKGLGGRIPAVLANLANVKWVSFGDNRLTGEIPPELGHLRTLTRLELDGNQLSGSIPPELGALSELYDLSLAENRLTGSIPTELGQLEHLRELSLQDNQLEGEIPSSLARLNSPRLDLRNNQLSGSIPTAFAEVDSPWHWRFWLGGNQLTGCLPNIVGAQVEDRESLGLRYCQCPDTWKRSSGSEPDLSFGADGIPFLDPVSTERPGTYRIDFRLVVDLPEGGDFRFGHRWRGRGGQILVRIDEDKSASYLVIDPFTGAEFKRSVTEGPAECEVGVSQRFDQIVESARIQPLDLPLAPNGYPWMYPLHPVEGGRTYYISKSGYWVADVPEGLRLTVEEGGGICEDPGGCYGVIGLRDESSGSYVEINGSTGAELRRVLTEEADQDRVSTLFDALVASIRREEPRYLRPSCETAPTADDCAALLEAAEALAVEADLNWHSELDLRRWKGVTVDRWTGRVVALNLSYAGLDGQLAPALGRLSALETLSLYANDLTGAIPPALGRLANLTDLSLGANDLSGEIPPELANLESLDRLFLNGNNLEGCVPAALERFTFSINDHNNPGLRHCGSGR